MSAIVQAVDLGRWYGQVVGVNDLTVEVEAGITGLLGPNGAGKSTFMKLATGTIRPSRGMITVLGEVPFANRALYRRLGTCPEHDALYGDLTGLEFVTFVLRLQGLRTTRARATAAEALARVGLEAAAGRRASGYSKGMRQRLKLAQAIAHRPELLVVDEPLAGLDPLVRARMIELFRELRDDGVHILISSHVLHEIEALTDKIVLIHRGRVLADGSVPEIRRLLDRHPRRLRLRVREARRLAALLMQAEDVVAVRLEPEPDLLSVETRDQEALFRRLAELVCRERPGLRALEVTDAGLEAVFDYLVG